MTFVEAECEVLLDRPGLIVLGAPLDLVFLMKLFASRAADVDDLEVLWEHCSFETPEEAARAGAAPSTAGVNFVTRRNENVTLPPDSAMLEN